MALQLGKEACEHDDLFTVVANDVGNTDDAEASQFWQSSDVVGFSDYQRLFMFLESTPDHEKDAAKKASDIADLLRSEAYVRDQVVEGKVRPLSRVVPPEDRIVEPEMYV